MGKRHLGSGGVKPAEDVTAVDTDSSARKRRKTKPSELPVPEGSEAKNLIKEERREQKRLKREQKIEIEDSTKDTPAIENAVGEPGSAADKARRKAEKKQLKAVWNTTGGDSGNGGKKNKKSSDKAQLKAARKLEKNRLEDTGAVEISNGNGAATNGHGLVTPAVSRVTVEYKEDLKLSSLPQSDIDDFLSKNFITITDPTTTKTLRPIVSFSQLPPSVHMKQSTFGSFKSPTPIQSAAWPFLLSGRDVIGVAETGSGKTLAFGVPCVRYIKSLLPRPTRGSAARAVIVSPTRELAVQIHEQITSLATAAGLDTVCVYGGVPKDSQRKALKTAHIIVATPGRLNDLINEGSADLSNVGYVVLDEADRMLDKGFEEEIRKIISTIPSSSSFGSKEGRQTLMFTATWPSSVRDLAATFMHTPVKIAIGDNPSGELRANKMIAQRVEVVDPRSKETRLLQLIKEHQSGKAKNDRILVFCLYKKEATRIEGFLRHRGLRVAGIHGDLSQEKRSASLESFKKEGGIPLLVATDVAARGLDIPAVKVVINVTFPLTVEDYVHRIGRTGRAGAEGLAITMFTDHDKGQSGSLINVLKAAGQPVPDELLKFGTTVKKKGHDAYGAFYKETENTKAATKIKFDD